MRYGFYLPTRGRTATPEDLETLVRRGEALGFASVMIADHIVFPSVVTSKYPYTVSGVFPGQGDALEQLALMAFIAGKTERLRLVTSVMILPYRNPVATAKTLATIDVLSRGRVTVGVGVGWLREEFEALGAADFDRRGAVSDEYLRIFKALWTESPVSFAGEFYRFDDVRCLPAARAKAASADLDRRPQQGRPPAGRAARRRLAPGGRKPGGPAHARRPPPGPRRAVSAHRGGRPRSLGAHDLLQGAAVRRDSPRRRGRRPAAVLRLTGSDRRGHRHVRAARRQRADLRLPE